MKKLVIVSIALNAALGVALAYSTLLRTEQPTTGRAQTMLSSDWTSEAKLYSSLVAVGIAESTAKRLLLVDLSTDHQSPGAKEYWRAAHLSDDMLVLEQYARDKRKREALLIVFGESAYDDDAFTPLFRPFNHRLSFISARAQLELQAMEMEQRAARIEKLANPSLITNASQFDVSMEQMRRRLEKILTAEELFEYELRVSPIAQKLLATGFGFTEKEFRDSFRAITQNEFVASKLAFSMAPIGTRSSAPVANDLRKALGDQRYNQFVRLQDPVFRLLMPFAKQRGVSDADVDAAYRLIIETRDRELKIRERGGTRASIDAALREIASTRDHKLQQLLGVEAFSHIQPYINSARSPVDRITAIRG